MSYGNFLSYRSYRWLWITALALLACFALYRIDDPIGGRNGGSVVGYTLGALATAGIVWLMAFGLRKRSYSSSLGTLEGWLAAHVWVGIGLSILVPLHAGFSFGCNIHTLAYVLMLLTIITGIWGAANYTRLSSRIESHRGGLKAKLVIEQLQSLDRDIEALLAKKSDAFLKLVKSFDFVLKPSLRVLLRPGVVPSVDTKKATDLLLNLPEGERADGLNVLGLIDQKSDLARHVAQEAHIKMLLRVWLFLHVPISVALCGAVAIHIFSVFFYR